MGRDLTEIYRDAIAFARGLPEPDPSKFPDELEWHRFYWTITLARAAGRLADTIVELVELRKLEVTLVTRALTELCVSQALISEDADFARTFSLQEHVTNEGIVAMLTKYGTGESEEASQKAQQVAQIGEALRALGYEDLPAGFPPLEMTARARFEAAGLGSYYETFYSLGSDFTHMNARAVHRYLDGDFDDERAAHEVILATDLLLRTLMRADEIDGASKEAFLKALVGELGEVAS